MKTTAVTLDNLAGVFAVPPLARRAGAGRPLDLAENDKVVRHMSEGGLSRFLYGGNAFLYHVTLAEYEQLLDWMSGIVGWAIPSLGPSFGRAMDQARMVRQHRFRTVMHLPCGDPRDAAGLEAGIREIADATGMPLILYLKAEDSFGSNTEAGLDALGRLMRDGVAVSIKYAVVRDDPRHDPYLDGLLRRVDRARVISGIGERPAVVHMRDFGLPGFTTGSGCIASASSSALFEACRAGDWDRAELIRAGFIPFEDLRDEWGPARVLHQGTELAGIAPTGPIPPFVTGLDKGQLARLAPVAQALRELTV